MDFDTLRKRYDGYTDDEILGALKATQYPDYSISEIAQAVGYKPRPRSLMAVANDTVIEAANATAGAVGSAADFISPGNRVSEFIDENIIRPGEESQSDVVQQSRRQFQEEVEAADGIGGELMAVGRKVLRDPLLTAAQAAGSFVIPGAAVKGARALGGAAGLGAAGVSNAGLAGGAVAGGALAGGDAAGTAYDLVIDAGGTEAEAVAAARQASRIPSVVGAAGGLVGAERLLAGAGGMKGGLWARAFKTGAVEGAQEGFEEGITQFEGQRAAMPFDSTIDPMKGVGAAAGMGAAMGGGIGLATGAFSDPAEATQRLATAQTVEDMVVAANDLAMAPLIPVGEVIEGPPLLPTGDARELTLEQAAEISAGGGQFRTPARIAADGLAEIAAQTGIPAGQATEITPEEIELGQIPVGEVYEEGGQRPEGMSERTGSRAGQEIDLAGRATVAQYVSRQRQVNTPAARAFVQDYEAGRITPADVLELVVPTRKAEPTPDDRIARAAAQAPTIQPGDLLTADGMPYGTKAAASVRATREGGGDVVQVPGGFVVRQESQREPVDDLAGAAAVPVAPADGLGDQPGGSIGAVRPVPALPGEDGGSAAAPSPGSGQADPVGAAAGVAGPALSAPTGVTATPTGVTPEAVPLKDRVDAKRQPAPQAAAPDEKAAEPDAAATDEYFTKAPASSDWNPTYLAEQRAMRDVAAGKFEVVDNMGSVLTAARVLDGMGKATRANSLKERKAADALVNAGLLERRENGDLPLTEEGRRVALAYADRIDAMLADRKTWAAERDKAAAEAEKSDPGPLTKRVDAKRKGKAAETAVSPAAETAPASETAPGVSDEDIAAFNKARKAASDRSFGEPETALPAAPSATTDAQPAANPATLPDSTPNPEADAQVAQVAQAEVVQPVQPPAAKKRPPKSFRKKVKVTTPVYVEETSSFEQREIDADTAIKALNEDISELERFMACLKG